MGQGKSKNKIDSAVQKAEAKVDKELDNQIWKDKEKDSEIIKLLLLGAGESGKSTLFKQMIKIYGTGFSEKDLLLYIPMIHNNTIAAMKELCEQYDILCHAATEPVPAIEDQTVLAAKQLVEEAKTEDRLTVPLANAINALWKNASIKATYSQRAKFQLMESCNYFFDDIFRLVQPKFVPVDKDLIYCRVRTTGIVENKFTIDDNQFMLIDVGGQRNERKKWIHCFEGVCAVIFVADLSEYDRVLYEDGQTNRMDEALKLFAETTVLKWFANTAFILFLNKRDLFEDKIQHVPLTVCFPEYAGRNDYHEAVAYIQNQFESRYPKDKLYTHVTCATDTSNVAAVFGAVKDIIVSKHLQESGLI